jgi:hypothetical protein
LELNKETVRLLNQAETRILRGGGDADVAQFLSCCFRSCPSTTVDSDCTGGTSLGEDIQ